MKLAPLGLRIIGAAALLHCGSALAEDWARLAAETDEPGFALRIVSVDPGSQAETLGLQVGDYIYQIGERCTAALPARRRDLAETIFYCRAGSRKEMSTVERGLIGVKWATSFRPQLEYLRGEIGTSGPSWDESVANALALLETDPASAEEGWRLARDLGYPDDELHAFVQAYCDWRLGREMDVGSAVEAINEEFSTFPHLYAAHLEHMAHASGRTDLLRRLHEMDAESSQVPERWLEQWEHFDSSPLPERRLLDLAETRRGRSLLDELTVPPLEEDPRLEGRLRLLLGLGSRSVDPGKYNETKFALPETVRNFHCSLALRLWVREFHDRWDSAIRIEARSDEATGERFGTRHLAELTVIANRDGSTSIFSRGGHNEARRRVWLHDEPIPVVGEEPEPLPPETGREFRLDLVRLGREIAVYANGVAYAHLPIDQKAPTESLFVSVFGVAVDYTDFQVWSLSDNP